VAEEYGASVHSCRRAAGCAGFSLFDEAADVVRILPLVEARAAGHRTGSFLDEDYACSPLPPKSSATSIPGPPAALMYPIGQRSMGAIFDQSRQLLTRRSRTSLNADRSYAAALSRTAEWIAERLCPLSPGR